ncbi:MAG TPA: hypothetical protein PL151_16610 [Phycisphaerae bacterium]|nr:hypothetical protein [Phycisphaerae bacterium]HOJ74189.1 hypothetical protein [Phycisphaerae bacterium]HOM51267.1 hypothetical protein [Phycisphaerae bacterium]HON68998.1 hypothetical protein [Phycisphaerae bacterium]HOQ87436.1 hypothetical protein [Phycisphaerae bacterium]
MSDNAKQSPTVAAVCDPSGPHAARMAEYLQARGEPARWYAPRDLDDVDREVSAGRLRTAVFVNWRDLLEGIWHGEVTFSRWRAMRIDVQFLDSPGDDAGAQLEVVAQAWADYQQSRRRRRAISGLILSLIAVAAAFVLTRL